jgi:hypothetical protein
VEFLSSTLYAFFCYCGWYLVCLFKFKLHIRMVCSRMVMTCHKGSHRESRKRVRYDTTVCLPSNMNQVHDLCSTCYQVLKRCIHDIIIILVCIVREFEGNLSVQRRRCFLFSLPAAHYQSLLRHARLWVDADQQHTLACIT